MRKREDHGGVINNIGWERIPGGSGAGKTGNFKDFSYLGRGLKV